jgi:hypothetical protein
LRPKPVGGFNEKLFALCVAEKWTLRELFMQKQSIDDVFARREGQLRRDEIIRAG